MRDTILTKLAVASSTAGCPGKSSNLEERKQYSKTNHYKSSPSLRTDPLLTLQCDCGRGHQNSTTLLFHHRHILTNIVLSFTQPRIKGNLMLPFNLITLTYIINRFSNFVNSARLQNCLCIEN